MKIEATRVLSSKKQREASLSQEERRPNMFNETDDPIFTDQFETQHHENKHIFRNKKPTIHATTSKRNRPTKETRKGFIESTKKNKTSSSTNLTKAIPTHYRVSGGPIMEALHSNTLVLFTNLAENPSTGFLQRSTTDHRHPCIQRLREKNREETPNKEGKIRVRIGPRSCFKRRED